MVNVDNAAPGWDAIDAALSRLYPDVEPTHYGTLVKWMLGGPDPLDGISVYRRADHWHFISYGMSSGRPAGVRRNAAGHARSRRRR